MSDPAETRRAFLTAVRASPADDLPRLVYADWLEEAGERQRAAFIRVQCELAALRAHPVRKPNEDAGTRLLAATKAVVPRLGLNRAQARLNDYQRRTASYAAWKARVGALEQEEQILLSADDHGGPARPGPSHATGGPWENALRWVLEPDEEAPRPHGITPVYRRGFVAEIALPTALFLKCGRRIHHHHLVNRWVMTDVKPKRYYDAAGDRFYHSWAWGANYDPKENFLPERLWELVASDPQAIRGVVLAHFPTSRLTREALSRACSNWVQDKSTG